MTQFPIGLFQNLNHSSLTNAFPLSLTLSLSQTTRALLLTSYSLTLLASPTPTLAHPLTLSASPSPTHSRSPSHSLSLTNPLSRLCQSPSPPSHRHPVTVSTLSLTISTLSLTVSTLTQSPLFHIHQLRQKNRETEL